MKFDELLNIENIATHIEADDKYAIIQTLIQMLGPLEEFGGEEQVYSVVKEREELMSTGVGHGIAIPHGKMDNGSKIVAALCTIKDGIDFESPDKMPVHLIILLVGPKSETGAHIRSLAYISKILQDDETRKKLFHADSADKVLSILKKREEEYFS